MLRRIFLLTIWSVAVNGFQQQPNTIAASEQRVDIYGIYSLMLTDPKTSHGPDNNQVYLIRDTTVPGTPTEPCVRVPSSHERSFAEVLADYKLRKDTPATLERALATAKPYELLNRHESEEFIQSRGLLSGPRANMKELFRKATDLFGLTDVYFNHDRTLALTGISTYCGSLCGSYEWKVFEKTNNGHWEERPWVGCRMIASRASFARNRSTHG
jgi:hypothetical protein